MSVKKISRLIAEGKYDQADELSNSLDRPLAYVFQSRIAELTGYFHKALELAKSASDHAKTSSDKLAAACAQAYAYWRLFEFENGHEILDHVEDEKLSLEFSNNPWEGTYHNIRGLLYWKDDQLEPAFDQFEKALVIRRELGNQSQIAYTLNNLGNAYLKYNDYDRATEFYENARQIRKVLQHSPALAASANSFGRLLDAMRRHSEAKEEHQTCLSLWELVGNTQFIGKAYRFLAINAYYLGIEEERDLYFDKSDIQFTNIGNKTDLNTNTKLRKKFSLE